MRWFFVFFILGLFACAFIKFSSHLHEGVTEEKVTIIIKPGTSSYNIAEQLTQNGILSYPWKFLIGYWLTYPRKPLIAGEYLFTKKSATAEVLAKIQEGRTVVRKFTVPEGWTVAQVVAGLQEIECLTGAIETIPLEGSLLPETYFYAYGDDRQSLLNRMQAAMTENLQQLWQQRQSDDQIIQTPQMALILASIVEKETGLESERSRIAGVFINRLRLKMPLQSDPTVIYALTLGQKPLDRALLRGDLALLSAYNTYRIVGLPPQPIACPGKESLRAVLNPLISDDLYFVANGKGGHTFSKTLAEHNQHVAKWRQFNQLIQKR